MLISQRYEEPDGTRERDNAENGYRYGRTGTLSTRVLVRQLLGAFRRENWAVELYAPLVYPFRESDRNRSGGRQQ